MAKAKQQAFPARLLSGRSLLVLVPFRALLVLSKAQSDAKLKTLLDKAKLVLDDGGRKPPAPKANLEHVNGDAKHRWVRSVDDVVLDTARIEAIHKAFGDVLDHVAPVYQRVDTPGSHGLVSPRPDTLLVRFAPRGSRFRFAAMLAEEPAPSPAIFERLGLKEDKKRSARLKPFHLFEIDDPKKGTVFDVLPVVASARDLVASAVLECRPLVLPFAGTQYPIDDAEFGANADDDETVGNQWTMKRVGAPYAWFESTGSANVVVYLFDRGVRFATADLPAFTQIYMFDGSVEVATQPNAEHGTGMLSVLGAPHNVAAGAGMAGLAPGCTFVSLRTSTPLATSDLIEVFNQIAADHAADSTKQRILCSATPASSVVFRDTAVNDALNLTLPADCLVCAPSGNFGTDPADPFIDAADSIGYLTFVLSEAVYTSIVPNMLICGMTEQFNAARHYDDWRDSLGGGAANVGSKFGPELDVVAPGVGVRVRTTVPGYGNAIGTSYATAHVAGIAALVRSVEPGLTGAQVRTRILQTTAKTGSFGYGLAAVVAGLQPPPPNSCRNDHMGYGRVDAAAVTVWTAAGQANVIVRDNNTMPAPTGDEGAEPSMGWWNSDMIIVATDTIPGDTSNGGGPVTSFPAVTTQGSALDGFFTAAVNGGNSTIGAAGDHYVFIRCKNKNISGSQHARCIRATCVLASCSTGFTGPDDWLVEYDDVAGGMICCGADAYEDGYYASDQPVVANPAAPPVAPEDVVIFRLHVTAAQVANIHTPAFEYAPGFYHACALVMVDCSNDISTFPILGDFRNSINNLTQRNLAVV